MESRTGPLLQTIKNPTAGVLDVGAAIFNMGSAFAGISAARAESKEFEVKSLFDRLAAKDEEIKGKQISVLLKDQFLDNISAGRASFAARNVSVGSGIGRKFTIQNLANLNKETRLAQLNSAAAQKSLEIRSLQAKSAAKTASALGILRAAPTAFKGLSRFTSGTRSILGKTIEVKA